MHFSDLGLSEDLLNAVTDAGYSEPTPIQAVAIPYVLMGRDILGCAQTGTGKTASFTLPMIDILAQGRTKARMPRSLILEPTRELAAQVAENFDTYGKNHRLTKALLIGGESLDEQAKILNKGVDVLIATPGRLIDMFERGFLLLNDVKVFVIDESDRMLDMGFIPDVERIASMLPPLRTTLLFSATMPREIKKLAERFLLNPKEVTVAPPSSTADTIKQGLLVISEPKSSVIGVDQKRKREALRALIDQEKPRNALIFCNRKRDVDIVHRSLNRHGYEAARLHGDMSQPLRMETLAKFKTGIVRYLVCSDVAARGLDVPEMSHVFNYDVPIHAEDYVHRIGRTGRAGHEGHALTIVGKADGKYIEAIERIIKFQIPRITLAPSTSRSENTSKTKRKHINNHKSTPEARPSDTKLNFLSNNVQVEAAPKMGKPAASGADSEVPETSKDKHPSKTKEQPVKGLGDHVPAFMLREVDIG